MMITQAKKKTVTPDLFGDPSLHLAANTKIGSRNESGTTIFFSTIALIPKSPAENV